jgi:hypothetical protein
VEPFVRDFPDEYEQILSVPPGLTGPAQVEFAWEGEVLARAHELDRARVYRESILPLKIAIDLRYVERHSVRGDLVLMLRTAVLPAVRLWRRVREAIAYGPGPALAVRVGTAGALCFAVVALAALLLLEGTARV